MMNAPFEDLVTLEDNEFEGFSDSESSETTNGSKPTINDQLTALLESNRLLQSYFTKTESLYSLCPKNSMIRLKIPPKRDSNGSHHREQMEGLWKSIPV